MHFKSNLWLPFTSAVKHPLTLTYSDWDLLRSTELHHTNKSKFDYLSHISSEIPSDADIQWLRLWSTQLHYANKPKFMTSLLHYGFNLFDGFFKDRLNIIGLRSAMIFSFSGIALQLGARWYLANVINFLSEFAHHCCWLSAYLLWRQNSLHINSNEWKWRPHDSFRFFRRWLK